MHWAHFQGILEEKERKKDRGRKKSTVGQDRSGKEGRPIFCLAEREEEVCPSVLFSREGRKRGHKNKFPFLIICSSSFLCGGSWVHLKGGGGGGRGTKPC